MYFFSVFFPFLDGGMEVQNEWLVQGKRKVIVFENFVFLSSIKQPATAIIDAKYPLMFVIVTVYVGIYSRACKCLSFGLKLRPLAGLLEQFHELYKHKFCISTSMIFCVQTVLPQLFAFVFQQMKIMNSFTYARRGNPTIGVY